MNTDWPCAPDPETAHSIYAAQAAAFYACAASFGVDFHQTAYDTSGVPTSTWEPQIYTYHIPPPATTTIVEVTRLFEEVTQLPDGRIEVRTNKATLYVAEPAVWQTAAVVTLTNSLGQPTATTTSFPRGVIGDKITQTLRNPEKGVPTATITTIIPFSTTVLTLTNSAGQPTATVTEYATFPDAPSAIRNVRMPQRGDYFIGSFLPVLLTTLLSIAIEAVDAQLKVLLPFHALTRPGGSRAKNSMSMQTDGPSARLNDVLLIFQFRDPISFLGDLLVISSAILTAMSSEVIGMEWFGTCGGNSYYGCFMVLAIYKSRARIVEGLLVFMAVAVALLGILLFRWRTGVAGPPWSIASVAALLSESPDMREVFQGVRAEGSGVRISEEQFKEQLEGKMFALGPAGSGMQYGITVCSVRKRVASGEKKSTMNDKEAIVSEREIGVSDDDASSFAEPPQSRTKSRMSCFSIHSRLYDYLVQGFLLIILCATLAVVLRYDTVTEYSPFETFMDSQTFGVRFLFTAVGVVITFLWEYLFSRISTINPYQRLSKRPQTARSSILLSPTNTVVGSLTNALFDRDIFAASIALATLLSKFTPIILSNIPYKVTQTWMTHVVCGWMTAAILACMILVLLGSILVRFPKMPVEPYTIAKSMYYLCDSHMLRDFEGLATLTQKERNRRIEKMGRRYRFGKMVGVSGETRIGIDYADDGKG
ncbi:hypothetical protein B0H63DRAFT_399067 [Podospora didyma]|uniref:Uncharacterized protein n=1 Tax=Podospora didyma TaxID=330526 RepID=A0AAE0KJL5_9PEZI|nr:hypothetical protein B0H63DRAFT_399067 [Podospora didyma]